MNNRKIVEIILAFLILFLSFFLSFYNSFFIYLISAILFLLIILLNKFIYKNNFSPSTLLGFGWLLPAFLLFQLKSNDKYSSWNPLPILWFVIFISFFSFLLGQLICTILLNPFLKFSVKKITLNNNIEKTKLKHIINIFFIIGQIGFVFNITNIISSGGFSIYSDIGLRDAEKIFGKSTLSNYLYFFNPLVIIFGSIYLSVFKQNKRIIFFMLISFISLFFIGIKSNIIFPVIISIFSIHLCGFYFEIKYYFYIILFMFLSFQLVTIGRDIVFILNDNLNFIDILFYRTDNIFLYFTSSFTNLQEEIIKVQKFQYGRESMQIFIEFFNFISGNRTPENIFQSSLEIHNYNDAYNTGTYLREHYRDFGLIGIIVFPFLYGLIATFTYLKFLKEPSIKHIAIYSIISTILISTFFSNHFLKIQYIFWIFVIIIFTKFKINNAFK